jgi:uncharacterized membrane protein
MAFCPSCGSPVEGRFCAKCGATVGAAAGGGAGVPPPSFPNPGPQPVAAGSGLSQNAAAALCYVLGLITGILFLVLEPYNRDRTIRFHAFQSIFLNVAWIAAWIVRVILAIMFSFVGGLWMLSLLLGLVFGLGFFILWLYLIISAYQGKTVVLPIIGPLAQKQA